MAAIVRLATPPPPQEKTGKVRPQPTQGLGNPQVPQEVDLSPTPNNADGVAATGPLAFPIYVSEIGHFTDASALMLQRQPIDPATRIIMEGSEPVTNAEPSKSRLKRSQVGY